MLHSFIIVVMITPSRGLAFCLALIALWLVPLGNIYGQENDWTIVTTEADFPDVTILEIRNDSLEVEYQGHTALFPVESVTSLRYKRGSEWYGGMLIGGILGGGIIRIAVPTSKGDLAGLMDIATVATGIAGGALAGGITGSLISDEKEYDLSMLTTEAKTERIQDALRETEE